MKRKLPKTNTIFFESKHVPKIDCSICETQNEYNVDIHLGNGDVITLTFHANVYLSEASFGQRLKNTDLVNEIIYRK